MECAANCDATGRRRFLILFGAFVLCFCPLQCGTMPNRGSAKQRRLFLSNDVRPQPQRREEGSPRRRHLLRVCRSRGRGVGRSDLGMGLSPGGHPGFVRWRSRHDHCRRGGALLPLLPHRLPASRHGGPDRKRSLFAVRVPPGDDSGPRRGNRRSGIRGMSFPEGSRFRIRPQAHPGTGLRRLCQS